MAYDRLCSYQVNQITTDSVGKILGKTYLLLTLNVLFSTLTAVATINGILPVASPLVALIGIYGLMFLTEALQQSKWALLSIFAFTGLIGNLCGAIALYYLTAYVNGTALLLTALIGTALIFFVLSCYALLTRQDFSFLGGGITVLAVVALLGVVLNLFWQAPLFELMLSALFILFAAATILYETNLVIRRGETNYIRITITLFVALYNLFISLLRILSYFAGERRK